MYKLLEESDNFIGRLLHYYPNIEESNSKMWASWHKDYSLITGLTPALYTDPNGNEIDW